MKRIYKYELAVSGQKEITMHKEAKILSIQNQREIPCIWVLVDDKQNLESRKFVTCLTGYPIDTIPTDKYIGTFQLDDGNFVGHVFEE